jgi:hypothetical protein
MSPQRRSPSAESSSADIDDVLVTIHEMRRRTTATSVHVHNWKVSWVPRNTNSDDANGDGDLCAVNPDGRKFFSIEAIQRAHQSPGGDQNSATTPSVVRMPSETAPQLSIEEFLTASADHQDGVFRLVQYACKVVSAAHTGRRRQILLAIADNVDSSRALMRTFGLVYAIQAVRSSGARGVAAIADLSLLLYHPLETWYWVLHVISAPSPWRRALSRLVSACGLVYGVCGAIGASRRLRELTELHGAREQRASIASRNGRPSLPGETAASAVANQVAAIRRERTKFVLDALMSLNWAVDHPTVGFGNLVVGALGVASAWLGLRQKWAAHVDALEWVDDGEGSLREASDDEVDDSVSVSDHDD